MADRRDISERRGRADRRRFKTRRHTSDRIAVIEIAGGELRLVVLDRDSEDTLDKVTGAVVRWKKDATSLSSDEGKKELSIALRKLSHDFHLHSANLHFVLGGEFCVTKAIRGNSEEVRSELQQIKQRSRLYLMLGPGEKVSVSSSRPIDARHEYALAAICNLKTLEAIQSAAENAGLKIERIEPALVSLSRVIGRLKDAPTEPCLVIHFDQNNAELGICHEGQLLLDYRPGGQKEAGELVEIVRTHLNRLKRHVSRQLHEAPPELRQVYLCGEKKSLTKAYQAFAKCDQFDVHQIDPVEIQATWEFEKMAADTISVPALGTLLRSYLAESDRIAPNFMEHINASTCVPLGPILLRSAIPLVAVLLIACGLMTANYRERVAVNSLHRQVDVLLPIQGRAREMRLQLAAAQSKLNQLNNLGAKLHSLPADEVIGRVGHCMPSDVWLKSMVVEEMQSIKLTGVSYLEAGVFDFVRWLEQSPNFTDVALKSTRHGLTPSGSAIDFDVELNLGDFKSHVKEVARNE